MTPFYLPLLVKNSLFARVGKNVLTKGKKNMTGDINASSSKKIDMQEIKGLAKKAGCTINDVVMSSTSAAIKSYLRIAGDREGSLEDGHHSAYLNAALPANIRFQMYQSREDVRPENAFSGVPFKMPLITNMRDAYNPISKITKYLKGMFPYMYASYAVAEISFLFFPKAAPKFMGDRGSLKVVLGFSNTPGPVKGWYFQNKQGERSYGRWCQTYVVMGGRVGMAVSCISYDNAFKVSVTGDSAICQDTRYLVDTIEKNIRDEIERMKLEPLTPSDHEKKK